MVSAQDDGLPSFQPKPVCDLLRSRRIEGHEADANNVGIGLKVNGFYFFIKQARLNEWRHDRGDVQAGKHGKAKNPRHPARCHSWLDSPLRGGRVDQ